MRILTAWLVACIVVLTGCGNDDTPTTDPDISATSSPPANPGATEPTLPATAKDVTGSGAATFAAYYVRLLNFASHTGDVQELGKRSSSRCTGCQSLIELYRKTYENGGYFKDAERSLRDVNVTIDPTDKGHIVVAATVTREPGTWKSDSDADEVRSTAESVDMVFELTQLDGWLVVQYGRGGTK